jgi:phage terminase large subunit-like protein
MKTNYIKIFDGFMDEVLADTGNKVFPKTITKLVEYISRELEHSDKYYFDEDEVQKVLSIMAIFPMTKGSWAKQTFGDCILDWQVFFIGCIYGFKKKSDDTRRYRNALLLIARKNGKSALASACMVYNYLFDGEAAAECYSVANNSEQAKIVFQTSKTMLGRLGQNSAAIKSAIEIRQYQVLKKRDPEAVCKYLASNSSTLDGLGASLTVFDEVHEYKDDAMVNVMTSGSGHRSQPMMLFVTTAGFVLEGLLHNMYRTGKDILTGYAEDDTFLPMIWELDDDDDLHNPDCWIKPNPAARAGIVSTEWLLNQYQTAKNSGNLNGFRTKNLNQFVAGADTWVSDDDWKKCGWQVKDDDLKGAQCFIGIDLSTNDDLTSITLYFPEHKVFRHFDLFPEDNRQTYGKRNYSVYTNLNNSGELIFTPGNVIDYAQVIAIVEQAAKDYNLIRIAIDSWQSSQLILDLTTKGYDVHPFAQNFRVMGAAWKELTKSFLNAEISHSGSRMLNWQRGNVVLERNFAGLTKPDKRKSSQKIDTLVSTCIAYGNYLDFAQSQVGTRSRYEDDGNQVFFV